jgi:hypothetical protein
MMTPDQEARLDALLERRGPGEAVIVTSNGAPWLGQAEPVPPEVWSTWAAARRPGWRMFTLTMTAWVGVLFNTEPTRTSHWINIDDGWFRFVALGMADYRNGFAVVRVMVRPPSLPSDGPKGTLDP